MKQLLLAAVLICIAADTASAQQRKGTSGVGTAAFAIAVTDPDGKPLSGVLVTMEGTVNRSVRTEGGRIALENLPAGPYRLRFEREGFLTLERELAAKGGPPIDVKVTLKPAPAPAPPPPAPVVEAPPMRPKIHSIPAVVDVPALIEKNWVGRGPSKTTQISCGSDGISQVIQLNEALMPHDHADSDETFYVVAGEGNAMIGDSTHRLKAGVFLFVPRGARHGLAPTGKNPLIVLSSRPGERCK